MDVAQNLVAHGHAWSSIKDYTLSEVGGFLVAISKKEKRERAEKLSTQWMGTNLTQEGLNEMLKQYGVNISRKAESASPQKVQQEWKRLASFAKKEMR